ncbi:MAG: hypothetical protein K6F63_04185 [Lachnospiraceae bacterium]|nr:hypothetical protein [Lachnospiraceae bacterium]
MKKNKTALILGTLMLLVLSVNVGAYAFYRQKNNIYKDKCFIYEGNSYYAFGSGEPVQVRFIVIDAKKCFSQVEGDLKGFLRGEMGDASVKSIEITKSGKSMEYTSYILNCSVDLIDAPCEYLFNTLHINNIGEFELGNVFVERVATENNDRIKPGYHVTSAYTDLYELNVEDVPEGTEFKSLIIKNDRGEKFAGEWREDPVISGKNKPKELHFVFGNRELLNLKPIITYVSEGREFVTTALIPTNYKQTLSKDEVGEYIRSHYGE